MGGDVGVFTLGKEGVEVWAAQRWGFLPRDEDGLPPVPAGSPRGGTGGEGLPWAGSPVQWEHGDLGSVFLLWFLFFS